MQNCKFNIDYKSVDNLKQKLEDNNLQSCISVLDRFIDYSKQKYKVLDDKLLDKNLPKEDKADIIRKIAVAERKFRHMISVPDLCVTRAIDKKYSINEAMILTNIGILHDIGRIDEIIGQDKNTVFKNKVDHCQIGDCILSTEQIYDFLSEEIVKKYGDLIRKCVKYHGVFKLPEDQFKTQFEKLMISDIRLVDKSSIMNSFLIEDIETVIGISKEELAKTHVSDATYEELTTTGYLDRRKEGEEYTPNRHFMSHVSFIYDMNDYSLLTEGWVEKYLSIYNPMNDIDKKRKIKIKEHAQKHMKDKYN